jgi:hypothetical protein
VAGGIEFKREGLVVDELFRVREMDDFVRRKRDLSHKQSFPATDG